MSEETGNNETWSTAVPAGAASEPDAAERVGFCQNCGRPLTRETVRAVGSGVFCEPCLEARIGGSPFTSSGAGYTTPVGAPAYGTIPPATPAAPGEPSPFIAGLLGLIPGVGAIYNGQYAKGVVHLVIFAVLVSLSDNVNGIFGIFVAGWVFYQSFEAYHTAIARRDGLPLPNAFGFNDIGERMGFGKSWNPAGHHPANPVAAAAPIVPPAPSPAAASTSATYVPVGTVPVGTAPDWVGYVPPTAFASAAAQQEAAASQAREQAAHVAGFASYAAYAETYTGSSYPGYPSGAVPPPTGVAPIMPPARRFPVGALWLIALGALILIGNLIPDWRVSGRWLLPILFAGLAAWTLTRRLRTGVSIVCLLRWPVIFTVLAVLFGLQAAYIATLGQTWPILFIALGAVLLLERTAGTPPRYTPPLAHDYYAPSYTSAVPPAAAPVVPTADEAPARAAWTETDTPRDGQ
jgi:hypothetical protein